ncbi:hypothetical protein D0Z07_5265 [Hyphodiscus hymeniophilus]|uniref:Uncharacterized protein n=1 Tax=Hyphodiscus hymeniophilus TaxID=353542 RepID=A0A9P7AWM4_9HELO|nr:hypothetical protein D0Z07_5265 [Hyphodiscus hymeniophilus]
MDGTLEKRPLLLDIDELCQFVEHIRVALQAYSVSDDNIQQLRDIIHVFLDTEPDDSDDKFVLTLITRIRFDKLLADFIDSKTSNSEHMGLVAIAALLQRTWKERFKGAYLSIDDERLETMFTHGALRGLSLKVDDKTRLPLWLVERGTPIADTNFKPGQNVSLPWMRNRY